MPSDPAGAAWRATTQSQLLEALAGVVDPELGEDIVALGMVRSVECANGRARAEIALTIAGCPLRTQLRDDVTRHLMALEGIEEVEVVTGSMDADERARLMSTARRLAQKRAVPTGFPDSTRVLAIVSGKGGVGKSSVTAALALALSRRGLRVGLLDADIWGFSIPRLLGVEGPLAVRGKKMVPAELPVGDQVLKVVSMGFLSGEEEAIMWRGLVLARAVQHFLEDVDWGPIDYLLVDMPPGTGDVQMALARMLPRAEFLVVTTPSQAAAAVAARAADMARKGHVRVGRGDREHGRLHERRRQAPCHLRRGRRAGARQVDRRSAARVAAFRRGACGSRRCRRLPIARHRLRRRQGVRPASRAVSDRRGADRRDVGVHGAPRRPCRGASAQRQPSGLAERLGLSPPGARSAACARSR